MNNKSIGAILLGLLVVSACNWKYKDPSQRDTPTQGFENMYVEEGLNQPINAIIDAFEFDYPEAKIKASYDTENNIIQRLTKDTLGIAILFRPLNNEEEEFFATKSRYPKSIKIAEEGIAFILHLSNPDSIFLKSEMDAVLQGKITRWDKILGSKNNAYFQIAIDNPNSSIGRYLASKVTQSTTLGPQYIPCGNSRDVIEFVSKNPNSIGLISSAMVSDLDDTVCTNILEKVKVAWIQNHPDSSAVKPMQGYLKAGQYPYAREVFIINAEGGNGTATGFTSFAAGNKGQLILLKSGMVPAIVPSRTVNINFAP